MEDISIINFMEQLQEMDNDYNKGLPLQLSTLIIINAKITGLLSLEVNIQLRYVKIVWSFVKDLCIHSPMTLARKSCSNLVDLLKSATADLLKSAGINAPPPHSLQICSNLPAEDIYTKDLSPARVTILFLL